MRSPQLLPWCLALCLGPGLSPGTDATTGPVQVGDNFPVYVSGRNVSCPLDTSFEGPFANNGTLSVTAATASTFDASIVFGVTTILVSGASIDGQGVFSGSGTFAGGGASGTQTLSGVLLSTGVNSSGTFIETAGPSGCVGPYSVTGGSIGQAVGKNSGTIALTQQDQDRQGRNIASEIARAALGGFLRPRAREGTATSWNLEPTQGGAKLGGRSGLGAGGPFGMPLGAWGSLTYTSSSDDFVATAFDSDRISVLFGIDLAPSESVIVGLAFGAETSDIETSFNGGEADVDGLTLAPYIAVSFGGFSADFSAGYTAVDVDQFRTDPGTGNRVTSNPDGRRWFVSGNLNYGRALDNWYVGATLGSVIVDSRTESYVEVDSVNGNTINVDAFNTELGQLRLSGEVAYSHSSWEPFARFTLEHDFQRTDLVTTGAQPDDDRTGGQIGLGIRYFHRNGLTASLEYTTLVARGDIDEDTLSGVVRMEW